MTSAIHSIRRARDTLATGTRRSRDWARYRAANADVELLEAAFEQHVYERHFHETYAIGVTLRGVQRFRGGSRTHNSMPGDVMVIPPGEIHDGESGAAGGYAYRMFYIREAALRDVLEDALATGSTTPPRGAFILHDAKLARRVNSAWKAMSVAPDSLRAEELFRQALALLSARDPRDTVRCSCTDRNLLAVRSYLLDNLLQHVSMQALASVAGLSRFQLTRRFQRAFGLPLHAYQVQARLQEAKLRLRAGADIASVAHELGFADQSHLHRRFKGAFGITPAQWRNAFRTPQGKSPSQHIPRSS